MYLIDCEIFEAFQRCFEDRGNTYNNSLAVIAEGDDSPRLPKFLTTITAWETRSKVKKGCTSLLR